MGYPRGSKICVNKQSEECQAALLTEESTLAEGLAVSGWSQPASEFTGVPFMVQLSGVHLHDLLNKLSPVMRHPAQIHSTMVVDKAE